MKYGFLKIQEVEKLNITVITDNYYDCLRPNYKIAKRYMISPGTSIHSEHGLAYFIETVVDGRSHGFLFDYGLDFEGVTKNMELLAIDVRKLEALGLSHGHFDHFGNLVTMLKYQKTRFCKGIPLYVGGKETFAQRFANLPPGPYDPVRGLLDLGQLNREEIETLSLVNIVEIMDPTSIVPGAYLTGNIERVTEYEKGSPILLVKRGDELEFDSFMGEQSLFFAVKGKGLVVVSSCAHAGIVNTVKHAQKITGIEKIHAMIGGFHLISSNSVVIQQTVNDIKAIAPEYVVPMHCTGFEAVTTFAREMPNQFILNTAGTTYVFSA